MTRSARHLAALGAGIVGLAVIVLGPGVAQAQTDVVGGAVDGLAAWEAIILGLVEGVTEYLPVSSTGHLLVTNGLLDLDDTEASEKAIETYAICIQSGAILAVLFLYKDRIRQMTEGLLGRSEEGRRVFVAVVAAFVPTAIIALTFGDLVRDRLFDVVPVAIAWLVGGAAILVLVPRQFFDRLGGELGTISTRQAVMIGTAQAIALWPGMSRSLVTIVAAVAVGLTLRAAVEFSFLLGLVTLGAATVVEGIDGGADMIDTFGWVTPLIGLAVAFVSALVAVRWMVTYLQRHGFQIFGWYRVAVGALALILVASGAL